MFERRRLLGSNHSFCAFLMKSYCTLSIIGLIDIKALRPSITITLNSWWKKKPSFSQFLEFRTWMSFLRALHSLYNLILTSLSLASHLSENKVPTFPRKYASLTKNPSLNHDTIIFSIQFIKPSQILLNITITHLIKKKINKYANPQLHAPFKENGFSLQSTEMCKVVHLF